MSLVVARMKTTSLFHFDLDSVEISARENCLFHFSVERPFPVNEKCIDLPGKLTEYKGRACKM